MSLAYCCKSIVSFTAVKVLNLVKDSSIDGVNWSCKLD